MAEIVPATDDDLARASGGMQFSSRWIGKAMHKGRLVAAIGGVFEVEEGVWFGFLELPSHVRRPSVYRHVKGVLAQAVEQGATTIRATCDMHIPRAEEMMRRLGFEPTDEELNGKVIWTCQASKLSR